MYLKRTFPRWCLPLLLAIGGAAVAEPSPAGSAPAAPAVESGYVEVDGGRIFYEAAGRGPAVVMIHDGLLHRETWDAQFEAFAASHRVIRWDRRGYGRSEAPRAPFSHRDDLLALMQALEVERAALMGCSSGSLLAMEFALEHPERVSALVLVGPIVSGFGFSEHFRTRGGRGLPPRDAPVEEKIAYWTSKDPWIVAPESVAARETLRALLTANPQNLTHAGPRGRPPGRPTRSRLSEIEVPTLIVVGESDIPDVHTHAGVIEAGIDGAERVVLVDGGHLCHLEAPRAFNRVVLGFLESPRGLLQSDHPRSAADRRFRDGQEEDPDARR